MNEMVRTGYTLGKVQFWDDISFCFGFNKKLELAAAPKNPNKNNRSYLFRRSGLLIPTIDALTPQKEKEKGRTNDQTKPKF